MYELVPQSVLDEQVMFCPAHEPLLHVWFVKHVAFNCCCVLLEQLELAVPALLQV